MPSAFGFCSKTVQFFWLYPWHLYIHLTAEPKPQAYLCAKTMHTVSHQVASSWWNVCMKLWKRNWNFKISSCSFTWSLQDCQNICTIYLTVQGFFSLLKGASFKHVCASAILYLFLVMPVVIIAAKITRSKENSSLFAAVWLLCVLSSSLLPL